MIVYEIFSKTAREYLLKERRIQNTQTYNRHDIKFKEKASDVLGAKENNKSNLQSPCLKKIK